MSRDVPEIERRWKIGVCPECEQDARTCETAQNCRSDFTSIEVMPVSDHQQVVAAKDEEIAELEKELDEARAYAAECEAAIGREADPLVAQRESLRATLGRIRAAAESDAECPTALRDFLLRESDTGLPDIIGNDPDYSPQFQDEYQRLWHESAARAQKAEADLASLKERLLGEEAVEAAARAFACPAPGHTALDDEDDCVTPILEAALDKALSTQPYQENTFQEDLAEVEGEARGEDAR